MPNPAAPAPGPAHSCDRQSRCAVAGRRDRLDRRRPERDRTRLRGFAGFRSRPPCGHARRPAQSAPAVRKMAAGHGQLAGSGRGRRGTGRRAASVDRGQPAAAPDAKLAAALVEPLSSAETSLLAALAPLAANSPRDAKRFLNAYRLARCSGLPRPVMALMQAVAFADDDAQAAMRDRLAKGSGELSDVGGPAELVEARQGRPRRQQRPDIDRGRARGGGDRRAATPCRSERERRPVSARPPSARRRRAGSSGATGRRAICRNCRDR